MISPGVFFIFFILIFQAIREVKGQKIAWNDKKFCLLHFISWESYMIWLSFMVHLCEIMIFTSIFFFFQNFDFLGCKGQKMVQNEKKFCLSHSISQEPYIRWSSFVVCKCKMIISSGIFFILLKLWFFRLLGGSKGKNWPKMTENSVFHALYLRNHTLYDFDLWYTCVIG